jgi:hypothetical protein
VPEIIDLAEASPTWWGQNYDIEAMDAVRARREHHDKAVPPPPARVDVILVRMSARGPAPEGTAAEFMARFIGEAEDE